MPISAQQFSELVSAIYAAATDTGLWPEVLSACRPHFPGSKLTLHSHDVVRDQSLSLLTLDLSPEGQMQYGEYYAALNPFPGLADHRYGAGRTYTQDALKPFADLRGTEYFEDFMRPWGLEASVTATLRSDRRIRTTFCAQCPRPVFEAHGDRWLELMQLLAPHLQRAAEVNRLTLGAQLRARSTEAALDALRQGVFVLSPDARIQYHNHSGEALLQADGCVRQTPHGQLDFREPERARQLRSCLAAYLSAGVPAAAPPKNSFLLRDADGSPRHLVVVIPWLGDIESADFTAALGADPRRLALVFICPLGVSESDGDRLLAALFNWTPAETRLAIALANGETPTSYAQQRNLSINTVRTQLRLAMRKAGLQRHSALIQLVTQVLGALRNSEQETFDE